MIKDTIKDILLEKANIIVNSMIDKLIFISNTEINNHGEFLFFSLKTLSMINSAILGILCDHLEGDECMFEEFKGLVFDELDYNISKDNLEKIEVSIQ